jgi:hypothetical protein
VLSVEVSLQNLRITGQDYLSAKEYTELMMDKVGAKPLKADSKHWRK